LVVGERCLCGFGFVFLFWHCVWGGGFWFRALGGRCGRLNMLLGYACLSHMCLHCTRLDIVRQLCFVASGKCVICV